MTDIVNKETRSRMMASVRSKNTKPELEIRLRLFHMGFRYRLHQKDLVGKPDMVLRKHSSVIFVHGCFWHQHGCHRSELPVTRRAWWKKKLEKNIIRDKKAISELQRLGWRVLVIWECGFRKAGIRCEDALDKIACQARRFLISNQSKMEIPSLRKNGNSPDSKKRKLNGSKNDQ